MKNESTRKLNEWCNIFFFCIKEKTSIIEIYGRTKYLLLTFINTALRLSYLHWHAYLTIYKIRCSHFINQWKENKSKQQIASKQATKKIVTIKWLLRRAMTGCDQRLKLSPSNATIYIFICIHIHTNLSSGRRIKKSHTPSDGKSEWIKKRRRKSYAKKATTTTTKKNRFKYQCQFMEMTSEYDCENKANRKYT